MWSFLSSTNTSKAPRRKWRGGFLLAKKRLVTEFEVTRIETNPA